jgi:uncharacterized delta-60 repeat protein
MVAGAALALGLCVSGSICGPETWTVGNANASGRFFAGAALDQSFGDSGIVKLRPEEEASRALAEKIPEGGIVASGGRRVSVLKSSGASGKYGVHFSPSVPAGGKFSLASLAVDKHGRLLLAGTVRYPGESIPIESEGRYGSTSPSAVRVVRVLPGGRLDPSFGEGGVFETDFGLPAPNLEGRPLGSKASVDATGIAIDSSGRIVLTGDAELSFIPSCVHDVNQFEVTTVPFVARLNDVGTLDTGFGGDGLVGGRSVAEMPLRAEVIDEPVVSPGGKISFRARIPNFCIARHGRVGVGQLTATGAAPAGSGHGETRVRYVTAIAGGPGGSLYALREIRPGKQGYRFRLIKILSNGSADRSFDRRGRAELELGGAWGNAANSLLVDKIGRVIVGGTFVAERSEKSWMFLARFQADGSKDKEFGPSRGMILTPFQKLEPLGLSSLFFDSKGRLVAVHKYETLKAIPGLVLARYRLRG